MFAPLCLLLLTLIPTECSAAAADVINTTKLSKILRKGVSDRVYPGASAMAGDAKNNIYFSGAVGSHMYLGADDAVQGKTTVDTWFDLASVSKVISTTSATALLYEMGYIGLDDKIVDLFVEPEYLVMVDNTDYKSVSFGVNDKESVTVRNCLLHNAGFTPDHEPYWYWEKEFGCPNSAMEYPAEDTSCLDRIYASLVNETLVTPPGEVFVYSDLSFETLQFMIGSVVWRHALLSVEEVQQSPYCALMSADELFATTTTSVQLQCYFEAFVRTRVFGYVSSSSRAIDENDSENGPLMPHTSYLLSDEHRGECMPTMNDTHGNDNSYTGKRLQGQVGDGNCYAMGGIAGHAGVFSTAVDVGRFLSRMLRTLAEATDATASGTEATSDFFINATTIKLFTTINNVTQSSRALGWDTNTPLVKTYGYDNSCGTMSDTSFMHIGYTGTCVCVDPVNLMWSVVLTNRAYNCDAQSCPPEISADVKAVYREFNSELIEQQKQHRNAAQMH